ncbi:hypothetical protein GQR58_029633 [Nymphon striatum]|nr:hypothetical protein GQR58_029633 [Nymphon striatum]
MDRAPQQPRRAATKLQPGVELGNGFGSADGRHGTFVLVGEHRPCHTRDPLSVAIVGSADIANGKDLVAASNAEIRTDDDATGSIGIWSKVGAERNGSAIRQHDGDRRQQDIDDNADAQGPGDGSRCDPLGVACLFGHVRNVFEANEREEGHDRSGQDRAEDRGIVGLEHQAGQLRVAKLRKPVRRHDNKRADLDECHCCGEPHTFAHTRRCDRQHERHDDYRGNDVVDSGQRADITAEGERHDCAGDGARNNDTQPGNASKAWAKPSGDVHRLAASLREAAHELHVGQPRDACDRPGDQECQWRLVTGYAKDLTDERKDSCADGYPDAIEDQERKGQSIDGRTDNQFYGNAVLVAQGVVHPLLGFDPQSLHCFVVEGDFVREQSIANPWDHRPYDRDLRRVRQVLVGPPQGAEGVLGAVQSNDHLRPCLPLGFLGNGRNRDLGVVKAVAGGRSKHDLCESGDSPALAVTGSTNDQEIRVGRCFDKTRTRLGLDDEHFERHSFVDLGTCCVDGGGALLRHQLTSRQHLQGALHAGDEGHLPGPNGGDAGS